MRRPGQLDSGGPAADEIEVLWWWLLAGGTVVTILVVALLVLPMLRRRRHGGPDAADDRQDVPAAVANRWIVWLGVVMPGIVLIAVLAFSVSTMRTVSRAAPDGSVVIDVVSYQYWWAAEYPGGVTVANEIHVPAGEPVELRLISADVIHSFWVPALQGKLDMLPDGTNTLVIEADEPGEYMGACAEFCGVQHALMNFLVIAQPPEEFAAWLEEQGAAAAEPASEAAQRGRALFVDEGCAACHTVAGVTSANEATTPGPDLTHVASRRTLAADTIANTSEELARWLRDPDAVKPGTTMPAPELTDDELADLVAYLDGLR
ncbi:MAG: cytochrome c oxidase subunit II [Actinomycetota bacterium]|nr:cytochrome c oxidase subunit II [Actinomycetota bacterium]